MDPAQRHPLAHAPAWHACCARDSLQKLRDYPELYDIGQLGQSSVDEPTQLKILARGDDILRDFERLLKDEALELVQIDATYFVSRLLDAVQHLLPTVTRSLHDRLGSDVAFNDELTAWAVKHAIAGDPSDPLFAESIARQIVYRLLGKMLFYQSLRRMARHLPKLDFDGVDTAQILPRLRAAFAEARKIDYHAVFDEALPDRIQWPAEASRALAELIHDFNTRDFAALPQDVVGTVFERLIPAEERHGLGQYFTSENLCDLINAFCITSPAHIVLDPACGTGTFLIRAYNRLRWLGQHDHVRLLSELWGLDIAPFPAELATINLFRQRIAEHGNFPRVICEDFLRINPGDKFRFPPPKMDVEHPEEMEEPIPEFDAIVGNFPYVSADQIEKHEAGYVDFLHQRLLDDWFPHYPDLFYYRSRKEEEDFRKRLAAGHRNGFKRDGVQNRISGFADLYVYLFFHAARFVKPGGRLGIVTSNAWLNVGYGRELKEFLLRRFKIVAVLESRCEPWFVEASVNTVISILERCDTRDDCDANLVRFVKVKRSLAELFPNDSQIDAAFSWSRLDKFVTRIRHAGVKFSKTYPLGVVTEDDQDLRIRIVRQSEMCESLEQSPVRAKWGMYLRSPQVLLDIMRVCGDKLCNLGALAEMKFGSKTGINEFYHVSPEVAASFGIEEEYLRPLIKAAEDSSHQILVDPAVLGKSVFVCRRTKAELKKLHHEGALKYIAWGESQKFTSGKLAGLTWPNGIEVKNRRPDWYALPTYRGYSARLFWMKAYHDTYLQRYSEMDLIPDQRLYFLDPNEGVDAHLLSAILNSFTVALALETIAPITAGDGVCELRLEDARDALLIPDPRQMTERHREAILKAFRPLRQRPILRVFDEVKKRDRQAFDSAVLKAIGADRREYGELVHEGLSELIHERIALGQMRGKARKTKARGTRAEKKAAEEVLEEILPEGPLRFPEEFFSGAASNGIKTAVDLPEAPLTVDSTPLFSRVYTADGSYKRDVKSSAEGKFLLYAQRSGHHTAGVPTQTVEVTRTVANYEKYLRELRKQLYDAYYRRTLDTRTAARLTQAAFDRFHLPQVEG